ncbi:MAG: hypothetical protein QXU74_00345 [Candidatus Aenigmatarchaeota archaeon]
MIYCAERDKDFKKVFVKFIKERNAQDLFEMEKTEKIRAIDFLKGWSLWKKKEKREGVKRKNT